MKKVAMGIFAVLLIVSGSLAYAANKIFLDVEEGSWYESAASHLYSIGVIEGYPDSTFKPSENVTRAQMAVMLDRYDEYLNEKLKNFYLRYEGGDLSFLYPAGYWIEEEGVYFTVTNEKGRIEFFKGDRPLGFIPEEGDAPLSTDWIEVEIASGNLIQNEEIDFNEYTLEDGKKLLFFGVDSDKIKGDSYTVWAFYNTEEEKANLLEILTTLRVE